MTPDPVTVGPASTVKEIAQVLLTWDVGSVPVVDVGDLLVGVISDADLISREGYPTVRSHHLGALLDTAVADHLHHWSDRAEGLSAGEIMSSALVTCEPGETVAAVVRRMLTRELHSLPVVEDDRLVGVVTRRDCLALFDRPDVEVAGMVTQLLGNARWTPEGQSVRATVADGVVTLAGELHRHGDVKVVTRVAWGVPGVVGVVDRLTWRDAGPRSEPIRS
jgi:CBS domain-containing protein